MVAASLGWYLALGILSIIFFNTYRDIVVFLIVSLPIIVVGALFLVDGWKKIRV